MMADTELEYINPVMTDEDNGMLIYPFQIAKFKKEFFYMNSDKAPGPDGLNPTFY